MAHMLSLILFTTLLIGSLGLIAGMVRANAHMILAALGIEPASVLSPLPARPARRIVTRRVVRTPRFVPINARRAAA